MFKIKEKQELDSVVEQLEQLKKIKVPKPKKKQEVKYKVKSKSKALYVITILNPFIMLGVLGLLFLAEVSIIWIVIYLIFAIPIFLVSSMVFWIRVYLDRRKIKKTVIKRLAKNYVVANFFLENRRIHKEIFMLSSSGIELTWKNETYIVDRECIFFDEENIPNIYFRKGIPNPLKFNFDKYVKEYNDNLSKDVPTTTTDWENKTVDLSYSSENIQKFKKDKIFSELHRSEGIEGKDMITWLIMGVMLVVLIIVIIASKQ